MLRRGGGGGGEEEEDEEDEHDDDYYYIYILLYHYEPSLGSKPKSSPANDVWLRFQPSPECSPNEPCQLSTRFGRSPHHSTPGKSAANATKTNNSAQKPL